MKMRNLNGLLFFRILNTTVYSTVVLSLCAWIIQSSRYFGLLNSNNVPIKIFIKFISFLSIDIIAVILPIALSISVGFVYYRFIKLNQLTALQSIGISPIGLLRPVVSVLILLIGYLYISNFYLSPVTWRNFRNLEFSIRNNITLPENSGHLFSNNEISIYSRKYSGNFVFENLYIIDSRDPDKKNVFWAKHGTLKGRLLELSEGELIEIDKKNQRKSIAKFNSYTHDLTKFLHTYRRAAQANEKFLYELLLDINDEAIPQEDRAAEQAMIHQKITSPLLAIIFALIMFIATILVPYSRKTTMKYVSSGFGIIVVIQGVYFWIVNSAATNDVFISANYVLILGTLSIEMLILLKRG